MEPQSPTLLQELLAQSPALVHLQIPPTQVPAAHGSVLLHARPTQDPEATSEQLSMLPHPESPKQDAGVPPHVPVRRVQALLLHCEPVWQWHLPSASQVPEAHVPFTHGAAVQVPAS